MKFTVNAGDFDSALRSVQGRTKLNKVIPILSHVLVSAGGEDRGHFVTVLANDLDSSSFAELDGEVALAGSCAIPADPLIRIVGGLPKAAHIEIAQIPKSNVVTVKSGRSRYSIPVLPAADFPPALSAKDGVKFDVTADDLDQLFARPCVAVNPKGPRTQISGVFLHSEEGRLAGVATDGYTLLRFGSKIDVPVAGFAGVIVPTWSIDEILKIGAGTLTVAVGRTIEIQSGSGSYCSKLIDSTFPEIYRKIIPDLDAASVEIDREALLEALTRLDSIGSFSDCLLIDAAINDGEMAITLTGLAEGSETIECETTSAVGKFFCLRTTQLLKVCKTLRGDKIKIIIHEESTALRIIDLSEPDVISVEMPAASKTRHAAPKAQKEVAA